MHDVVWHTPSPLWPLALADPTARRFRRPELLRFAADSFMEDLQRQLGEDPSLLGASVARVETWREPDAGWLPGTASNGTAAFDPDRILKLYQPAHQRFYLVGAALVCRTRGLPDRTLEPAREDAVSFVVRRLAPAQAGGAVVPTDPGSFREYGWTGAAWVAVEEAARLDAREQRLPMFPISFAENGGRRRRLLAGMIPVAQREAYESAPREGASPPPAGDLSGDPLADPRAAVFAASVRDALRELYEAIDAPASATTDREARDVLAFALLDLATFVADHVLYAGLDAVAAGDWRGADPLVQAIYDALDVEADPDVEPEPFTWIEAVADAAGHADALLGGARDGESPPELLTDALDAEEIRDAVTVLAGTPAGDGSWPADAAVDFLAATADFLAGTEPPGREAFPGAPPEVDASAGAVYLARCVYERRACEPYRPPVVSPPTQAFRLASFFDPDAPVRPVRITMPVDTSIAGLRKSPKNVAILLSDQLRSQMERVQGVTALEDEEVGDDPQWTLGMICSLSIPIITICALILLMIIVQLLNIVFWWLPFFKICFPIPLKK